MRTLNMQTTHSIMSAFRDDSTHCNAILGKIFTRDRKLSVNFNNKVLLNSKRFIFINMSRQKTIR